MSGGELLQDQPAEQARENTHVEEKVGSAGDPARPIKGDAAAHAFGGPISTYPVWVLRSALLPNDFGDGDVHRAASAAAREVMRI